MTNKPVQGAQRVECELLASWIADCLFSEIYITLNVENPAYAPIVIYVQPVADDLASAISRATEGNRDMHIEVWSDRLYLECGQHPPIDEEYRPYVKWCTVCGKPEMKMCDHRAGLVDGDEWSMYSCGSCYAEVTIQVETYEGDSDDE